MSKNVRFNHSIHLRRVTRRYVVGAGDFCALDGVSLELPSASFVAVVGASGSGKSTLVNMIAGLDQPTAGSIRVGNHDIESLSEDELARWRGKHVGVVFQSFQLLPTLTAAENVALPMDFCGTHRARPAHARALELLESVGIAEQADKLPSTLSGGQQQRVAIARALANDPDLVVADEPTGNLDSNTAADVLDLLRRLVLQGRTVLVVTHDAQLQARADLVVRLVDGKVESVSVGGGHA
jgi:putative ABC transport system ATP-binding protein